MTVSSYDDIAVVNLALSKIAAESISSLDADDEDSDIAGLCARIYPAVRDTIISAHPWSFCKAELELSRANGITPIKNWQYAYRLPDDMLAGPFALYGDGSTNPVQSFEQFGDYLYCNYQKVLMDYRRRPPESQWPMFFVNLVATATAAELAIPITDSTSRSQELNLVAYGPPGLDGKGGLFATATRTDSQSKPIRSMFRNGDPLANTRF